MFYRVIEHLLISRYYLQVDSDFYLPVLMNKYFVENSVGRTRAGAFLKYVPIIFRHREDVQSDFLIVHPLELSTQVTVT